MRNRGDHFMTPLMVLSLMFLVAGLHDLARSSPAAGEEGTPAKPAQTRPAQTRPSRPQTQPAKEAEPSPGKEASEASRVYTDEDLKKYHDPSATPSTRPAAPPVPAGDPLKVFKDQQERSRWRQEKIVRMQQRILDLEGKLKGLEQKRLSVVNPLMPRPRESEAQKAEEKGLSGPELLARTDEEIKQTSQELESARKELADFLATTPE